MRTLDEVRTKFDQSLAEERMMNFEVEVLASYLADKLTDPSEVRPLKEEEVKAELLDYLGFAFDKAINHRGISASRSVEKLAAWAWVLGLDELVAFAADDKNYSYYGVPVLKKFAAHFGVEPPLAIQNWENGKPCEPDCIQGCDTPAFTMTLPG